MIRPRRIVPLLLVVLAPAIASGQGLFAPGPDQPPQAQSTPPAQSQNPDTPGSQSSPAVASGQSKNQQPGHTKNQKDQQDQTDKSQQDQKENESGKGKQTQRMLYVVPNFAAVSSGKQLPPLSTKEKFSLAFEDSFDYSSFVWTGILAAQDYGLNSYPELGTGITGYSRYYWRGVVDDASGTYFTEAIVPALTHEDPRYYTLESGGFFRRLGYALSRTVITPTDSGGTSFNFSEVGGNFCEAALSQAYYPPQERGVGKTFENWGTQMESAALNNIAKEFWPDFRRIVLRRQ